MNAHAKHEGLPGEELGMPIDPGLDPAHEAEILVLTPRAPEPNDGIEMDADIAEYWELWSAQIGHALVPVLEKLEKSLPGFTSAMICTADGFNLCTLGVEEEQVTRLSAMTSSLHSIADVMYARAPYTVISRAVHAHPTVSELIPTTLQSLTPL